MLVTPSWKLSASSGDLANMDTNSLPFQLARLNLRSSTREHDQISMAALNLRSLPAEIRNTIWEYALYEPAGVPIRTEPGLLRTCKAIRREAELMFYAVNTFRAQIEEEHSVCPWFKNHNVCKWLKNLGDQKRKLIRGLEVNCVLEQATISVVEPEEAVSTAEDAYFMQLMHMLESIRDADLGRRVENVVSFTVSSSSDMSAQDGAFGDRDTFEEVDQMPIEKQECCRAAKFMILWCVYGQEVVVEAMQASDGEAAIAELDRQIQESRRRYMAAMPAGRW